MNCRECAEFLADYVAGELPEEVHSTFERHLSRCPNCVTYMEQYRLTVKAGKAALEHDAAEEMGDVPEELIRAILAARSSRD